MDFHRQKNHNDNKNSLVYRLLRDVLAWNVDGSAGHTAPSSSRSSAINNYSSSSWIQYWEQQTGLSRSEQSCAFRGCSRSHRDAPLQGGHVWIARGETMTDGHPVIVPICRSCNYWENASRMQNSGSRLRQGVTVVKIETTPEIKLADRRLAIRVCTDCGQDIDDQPKSHKQCWQCYSVETLYASIPSVIDNRSINPYDNVSTIRQCMDCGQDICDQPESHARCWDCYRGAPKQSPKRNCQDCGKSTDDRPEWHALCLDCYRSGPQRRSCQDCGQDIGDRPTQSTYPATTNNVAIALDAPPAAAGADMLLLPLIDVATHNQRHGTQNAIAGPVERISVTDPRPISKVSNASMKLITR